MSGHAVDRSLQILVHLFLARWLGAAGYGVFASGFALYRLGQRAAVFGLHDSVVRYAAPLLATGKLAEALRVPMWGLRRSVGTGLVAAFVVAGVGLAQGAALESTGTTGVTSALLALAVPGSGALLVAGFWLRARGLAGPEVWLTRVSASLLFLALTALLVPSSPSPALAAGIFMACQILGGAVGAVWLVRLLRQSGLPSDASTSWGEMHRFTLRAGSVNIMYVALTQLPAVVLLSFSSEVAAGRYGVALRAYSLGTLGYVALKPVLDHALARRFAQGNLGGVRGLEWRATLGLLALGAAGVACFAWVGDWALAFLGDEYVQASSTVAAMIAAAAVFSATAPATSVLMMTGAERMITRVYVVSAILGLGSLLPLVHLWGAFGAAMSVCVSHATVAVLAQGASVLHLRAESRAGPAPQSM